jgi:hypothetical protein
MLRAGSQVPFLYFLHFLNILNVLSILYFLHFLRLSFERFVTAERFCMGLRACDTLLQSKRRPNESRV